MTFTLASTQYKSSSRRRAEPKTADNGSAPDALVVTADDFGVGVATSAGIIRAHLCGPVTATSVMVVTGDHVRASVPLLADVPKLDVGLHLVFTDVGSRPLVAGRGSGLVARDGRFLSNTRLWLQAWGGRLDAEAVFDEICAQATLFGKLIGRRPTHVDGHHHSHQLPVIRRALVRAVQLGILPPVTRLTVEPPGMLKAVASSRFRRLVLHTIGNSAAAVFRRHGLRANDYYIGVLAPADLRRELPWAGYLANLPNSGRIDWMVHPGLYDQSLAGRDPYIAGRVRELEALTSAAFREKWDKRIASRAACLV